MIESDDLPRGAHGTMIAKIASHNLLTYHSQQFFRRRFHIQIRFYKAVEAIQEIEEGDAGDKLNDLRLIRFNLF